MHAYNDTENKKIYIKNKYGFLEDHKKDDKDIIKSVGASHKVEEFSKKQKVFIITILK